MPDAPPPDEKDAEFLSDEELRTLARRHERRDTRGGDDSEKNNGNGNK